MNTESNPQATTPRPAILAETDVSTGIDYWSFLIRNAVSGAATATAGRTWTPEARAGVAGDRRGDRALHGRHRHLEVGQQREVRVRLKPRK